MPRKKDGHTFLSVEVPDPILEALTEKTAAAGESTSGRVTQLIAGYVGMEYEPPKRGPAPGAVYEKKPGPKPDSPKRKRKK
ncbi:hypothetical protein VT84_13855 [Gemmata sp. SH-PL17]|uniref:hypothetical protein n=1 Tax=Gemmata sp. SH-PL17 TaxID=1630693 RepID=UPI00078BB958|nr:hypothetical protein [Gemmata sp. SH-PL17]AMV25478.1 hypothetical protein VT84_13855 [Gemmata sp. SH-PL17]